MIRVISSFGMIALAISSTIFGQSKEFDVAAVKPAPSDRPDRFESYCADGGRFILRGTPLLWAIKWAYDIRDCQMSGRDRRAGN
jgi:hypothetical protein